MVVLAALVLGLSSMFVIDETEQAIVTQFGQYKWSATEPGLHFKTPFVQDVHRMERRVIGRDTTQGDYLTLDKKKLVADPVARWRIVDPLLFFKTVRDEVRRLRCASTTSSGARCGARSRATSLATSSATAAHRSCWR